MTHICLESGKMWSAVIWGTDADEEVEGLAIVENIVKQLAWP